MRILSIETSCDETAIALLDITGPLEKPEVKILGNSLYSQAKLHEQYGGVFPMLAKREHEKNLPILLEQVLKEAGITVEVSAARMEERPTAEFETHNATVPTIRAAQTTNDIDFIAVTVGPGLEPALWTGITFAEELGRKWEKPVVGANHMEGHIYSIITNNQAPTSNGLQLPALALLVSGGHTEIVEIKDFGSYKLLGHTVDDAAGEAFDKCARMLGLPYPGGPEISRLAASARTKHLEPSFKLPRPMLNSGNLNFSFSGLKTAVLYKLRELGDVTPEIQEEVAYEFEEAVMDVLTTKVRQAIEAQDEEPHSLIIAGGVAANTYLRERFEKLVRDFPGMILHAPTRELSTDNAVMIGLAAYVMASQQPTVLEKHEALRASGNLSFS